jgi:hypothetical protein
MNGSAPCGAPGPVTSLRAADRPRTHPRHSHGDRKSGRLAVFEYNGAVATSCGSADESSGWTDAVTVSLTGGA